jgi:gliding motility-associated-like protein
MDANGCSSSDVITVQVLPLPTASISYTGNPFCQTGTAPVSRVGQAGGTYSSTTGLIINPVTGEINLSSSTPGSYTVTYSFSNGSCTSQVRTEVSIFSLPIVVYQPTLPSVCVQGNPFTLTGGNPTGGVYRGRGVTGDIFYPGVAGIGLHVIEYTYTNAKGCASTATASIQVVALVRGNTNLNLPELCINANPLTLSVSNGIQTGGQFSGNGVVGDRFFPSVAGVGTHTIRYITPGVSGCAVLYTGTIQVNPKPALQVTAAQQVCEGMPVVINAQATGDLFWSDSTSTSLQNFVGSLTLRATRTTTYLITCRDGKGCSNVQPITIEVAGFPDANFRLDRQDFCNDGRAQVLVNGLSGGSFTASSGLAMNQSTGEINLSATQPGSYTITYQVTNQAGCQSSSSRSIQIRERPLLSLSNLILCVGTAQSITTTATLGGNSRWQSNQSDIVSVDAMGVVTGLRAGRTSVLFTNQAGCTTGLSVTVKDIPQITGRNIVCKNDSIRLTIATAGGVAGQFSSLFQSIVSVNNNGWVKGLQSGTAIIRYRDVDGCVATYPLQVDEVQERVAGPVIGCEPGTVRLDRTLQAAYGMSGYTFTFWRDAAQTGLLSNPLRIATSGIYYAQVINGNGCKLERPVELRVTIAKALQPKRLDTVKTQNNTAVQLQGRANGTSYLWSPSEGLNAVNVPNPWFRYNKNMEYRVIMQTDSGCMVTDTVFVKALDANVFVPTAFTPNRDGLNDKLMPVCFSIQRLSYFTIFNRWGEVVFTTNAIGKGWDGIAKGSPADPGTYVWMLEAIGLDGQVFRQKGTVVLIR